MTPVLIGVIGLVCFVVLMGIGVPIPFSMLLVGFTGCCILKNPTAASQILVTELTTNFSSYSLTVGALFGLMGFIANYTGLGRQLFTAVNACLGHWRGGLAMATQVACAGFGAICGSVPATIGTMSAIAYPQMRERGYAPGMAGASISAGAQISTIIPPSCTFIIYCMATNTSVGKEFMAGILPGILLTVANCVAIYVYVRLKPHTAPRAPRVGWAERWNAIKDGGLIQIAVVFLVSVGGMFAGFFTPTEAGAVGAIGMIVVTLIGRQLDFKKFIESLICGVELQTMVLVLLGCASVFSRFLNLSTLPVVVGGVCNTMLENGVGPHMLMIIILLLFFVMGMFADLISVTLMTIPIFYPIVVGTLGYDTLWFGVIISLLICLGGLTPPMGASVFMLKNSCKDPELKLGAAFAASIPYFISFLAVDIILVFFPQIATWLPNLLG